MNTGIVGTDMSLGKEPHPIGCGVYGRRYHAFRARTWTRGREAKLNGNGLERAGI